MNANTKTAPTVAVHKTIYAALAAAQAQMGPAVKDASNPHFKSKYADLSNVVDACLPALNANGIAVVQPPYDDDTGRYVKTIFYHGETGDSIECRVPLIVQKNDMQGYGSAVTYARRYGLMAMAGIAPEDDDGNAAVAAAPKSAPRQERPAPADMSEKADRMIAAIKEKGLAVTEHPRFVEDMQAMRAADAVNAARVDAEIATQKANADLGGDGVPF